MYAEGHSLAIWQFGNLAIWQFGNLATAEVDSKLSPQLDDHGLPFQPRLEALIPTMSATSRASVVAVARTNLRRLSLEVSCGAFARDGRRRALSSFVAVAASTLGWRAPPPAYSSTSPGAGDGDEISVLRTKAVDAFSSRDFPSARDALGRLARLEPDNPSWREALGQCYVDAGEESDFASAAEEFGVALTLTEPADLESRARILSNRALAWEGAGRWDDALRDYDAALASAQLAGLPPDPYVINSKGNCLASLGEYALARDAYLSSARAFGDAGGVNTARNNKIRGDGYTFAASNAALALAQLGDFDAAKGEMVRVSRRAPGNVDMRAGLAAIYWSEGRGEDAEREWEFACDRISVGCSKYRNKEWLRNVRRWPPAMVDLLDSFLSLS